MRRVAPWRVALRSLRYRPVQALVLLLLSTVGLGACVFAPIFERSVGQAQLRETLTSATDPQRGLALTGVRVSDDPSAALPTGLDRRLYGDPIRSMQTTVDYQVGALAVKGPLVNRAGQCGHLHLDAGSCPVSPLDAVASSSAARVLGVRVGRSIVVSAVLGGYKKVTLRVRVIGLYRPFDPSDEYWFGHQYSSAVGAYEGGREGGYLADALLTGNGFADVLQGTTQGDSLCSRSPMPSRCRCGRSGSGWTTPPRCIETWRRPGRWLTPKGSGWTRCCPRCSARRTRGNGRPPRSSRHLPSNWRSSFSS